MRLAKAILLAALALTGCRSPSVDGLSLTAGLPITLPPSVSQLILEREVSSGILGLGLFAYAARDEFEYLYVDGWCVPPSGSQSREEPFWYLLRKPASDGDWRHAQFGVIIDHAMTGEEVVQVLMGYPDLCEKYIGWASEPGGRVTPAPQPREPTLSREKSRFYSALALELVQKGGTYQTQEPNVTIGIGHPEHDRSRECKVDFLPNEMRGLIDVWVPIVDTEHKNNYVALQFEGGTTNLVHIYRTYDDQAIQNQN